MAKMSKSQRWGVGDVFLVNTSDGLSVVGQVVAQEQDAMNSATCAFFDVRVKDDKNLEGVSALPEDKLFSAIFATRDLLDNGTWRVVKTLPVEVSRNYFPYEHLRKSGWIGAKIIGSRNVTDFLNAFYGLSPWDAYMDPEYFNKLLISPTKRPTQVVFKKTQADVPSTITHDHKVDHLQIAAGLSQIPDGSATTLDRQTLEALRSVSNLSAVHLLLHYLYFPDHQAAENVAGILRDRQFLVEERLTADGIYWLVVAKHHAVPTAAVIAGVRKQMEQIAADNAGDYDGWEARVESDK